MQHLSLFFVNNSDWITIHCATISQTTLSITSLKRQREAKLSKEISLVARVYLILNFPVLLVTFYHQILGLKLETYNFYSWAETLAFLNSCSNPFICFWKNRQIRKKIKNILIKILGTKSVIDSQRNIFMLNMENGVK